VGQGRQDNGVTEEEEEEDSDGWGDKGVTRDLTRAGCQDKVGFRRGAKTRGYKGSGGDSTMGDGRWEMFEGLLGWFGVVCLRVGDKGITRG
jgi:hypothetical protein